MHNTYGETNLRTTIDLPGGLFNETMKATRIRTKAHAIIKALEEIIRKSKISELKQFKGIIDLNIDLTLSEGVVFSLDNHFSLMKDILALQIHG
jgi:hypothetical protein